MAICAHTSSATADTPGQGLPADTACCLVKCGNKKKKTSPARATREERMRKNREADSGVARLSICSRLAGGQGGGEARGAAQHAQQPGPGRISCDRSKRRCFTGVSRGLRGYGGSNGGYYWLVPTASPSQRHFVSVMPGGVGNLRSRCIPAHMSRIGEVSCYDNGALPSLRCKYRHSCG